MIRPLYQVAVSEPKLRPPKGHAGLWFDKFCNSYRENSANKPDWKLNWIRTVVGSIGQKEQIEEYVRRQARMVERLNGRLAVFTTESRFVTGLGRSHPVENGFAWHPALGTPYVAGSSVKGLLRAWVKQVDESTEIADRIFGKRDQAGGVSFLDAVPTAPVQLEADVMTPHYAGWTSEDPPGDWRSPTPIPFLVTAKQTKFLFGFTPLRRIEDGDLDAVSKWLDDALQWAGGGAKTAVGYGRFRLDVAGTASIRQALKREDDERRKAETRKEAGKTPEGRWRLELEGRSEVDVLDLVRRHFEKEPLSEPGERHAFANAVSTLHPDWLKRWSKGVPHEPGTNIGSTKLKKRARLLKRELVT